MHWFSLGLRIVNFRWNQASLWQHSILRETSLKSKLFLSNLYREGKKILLVCFLLPLKREKMSDTCSLFPPFGEPWSSCLLPSQNEMKWGNNPDYFPRRFIFQKYFSSVQSLSRVPLCNPMNHSTPHLPVHHQLPKFTQTQVHRVSDAIQPSHPLSSPSPHPNPSQHQSFPKSRFFISGDKRIGA